MKKIAGFFTQLLIVMALSSLFISITGNAAYLEISDPAFEVYKEGNIPAPDIADGQGEAAVTDFVVNGVLPYVKVLAGVVGLLFITLMGYTLVTANGSEEEISRARRGIVYCIIAFLIISMSEDIAGIFDMRKETIFGSPQSILNRVHLFDKQVEIFVTFVKYIIGAYATLMIVRAGISLVTAGGNEEERGKHQKSILFSLAGLALLYVGDIFINKVFYRVNKAVYSGITGVHPQADAKEGVDQIVGITNLVISFIGPVAVLMLLGGAIMYATAGGEEENTSKAKRIIVAAIVGIVIIYGAFAIVSTILSGKLEGINAVT